MAAFKASSIHVLINGEGVGPYTRVVREVMAASGYAFDILPTRAAVAARAKTIHHQMVVVLEFFSATKKLWRLAKLPGNLPREWGKGFPISIHSVGEMVLENAGESSRLHRAA